MTERSNGLGERRTKVRMPAKRMSATVPEAIGERNHEMTTPAKPLVKGKSVVGLVQMTASLPRVAIAMPIMPPTHEWVVETGISSLVARRSQMVTAKSTQRQPHMRRPGLSSNTSSSAMPLRMVLVTEPPRKVAPRNSKMTARAQACLTVRAFEPTEVA